MAIDTAGAYAVTLSAPIDHPDAGEDALGLIIPVDVSDGTATVSTMITITIEDDSPVVEVVGAPLPVLTVDETDLAADSSASFAEAFAIGYGADGAGTTTYALSIAAGPTGLVDVESGQDVVLAIESGQVVGRAGAGGAIVFTVAVNAATGQIAFDQLRAVSHSDATNPDDSLTLADPGLVTLTVTATDGDGDSSSATLDLGSQLVFRDDGPTARSDAAEAVPVVQDYNVGFVLDFSGSISNAELNTMLQATKAAAQSLFDGTAGDVTIRVVAFGSNALSYGPFTSYADFANQIDTLNPTAGGTRPINSSTNFTAAIQQLLNVYGADPSASNQVFFLSDGNPNQQTGSGGTSLTAATAAAWSSFVNTNGVNVSTLCIGDGINLARLQDVDVDGVGGPVLVSDFDDVIEALLALVQSPTVTGISSTTIALAPMAAGCCRLRSTAPFITGMARTASCCQARPVVQSPAMRSASPPWRAVCSSSISRPAPGGIAPPSARRLALSKALAIRSSTAMAIHRIRC